MGWSHSTHPSCKRRLKVLVRQGRCENTAKFISERDNILNEYCAGANKNLDSFDPLSKTQKDTRRRENTNTYVHLPRCNCPFGSRRRISPPHHLLLSPIILHTPSPAPPQTRRPNFRRYRGPRPIATMQYCRSRCRRFPPQTHGDSGTWRTSELAIPPPKKPDQPQTAPPAAAAEDARARGFATAEEQGQSGGASGTDASGPGTVGPDSDKPVELHQPQASEHFPPLQPHVSHLR